MAYHKTATFFRKRAAVLVAISVLIMIAFLIISQINGREPEYITITNPDGSGATIRRDYYDALSPAEKSTAGGISGNTLHPCTGNAEDECKGAPSIDFFPGGSEDAHNPEFQDTGKYKEIMGRITAIRGKEVDIKTSSGRIFTVAFPIDAVTDFNQSRSPNYQDLKVSLGDALHVDYVKALGANGPTISAQELNRSSLLLKDHNPKTTDLMEKY